MKAWPESPHHGVGSARSRPGAVQPFGAFRLPTLRRDVLLSQPRGPTPSAPTPQQCQIKALQPRCSAWRLSPPGGGMLYGMGSALLKGMTTAPPPPARVECLQLEISVCLLITAHTHLSLWL